MQRIYYREIMDNFGVYYTEDGTIIQELPTVLIVNSYDYDDRWPIIQRREGNKSYFSLNWPVNEFSVILEIPLWKIIEQNPDVFI